MIDAEANEVNPTIKFYNSNSGGWYDPNPLEIITEGGAGSSFTKNAKWQVTLDQSEIGNIRTFTLSIDSKVDYPIDVYFSVTCMPLFGNSDEVIYQLNEDNLSYSVAYCINDGVAEVIIPKTYNNLPITAISDYAFSNCTSLVSITISDSVTSIGQYAFWGCTSLVSITISNSVTFIGWSAFMDCASLKSITIPGSVTSIDGYAFFGCTSLESVIFENTTGWGTFSTSIASSDLADPATATKYLTDTYCSSDWKRS